MRRLRLILGFAVLALSACAPAQGERYDIILRGGAIIDGTGAPQWVGDVAIKNDRIVRVEQQISAPATQVIDARGLVVAPGFIDMHAHVSNITDAPLAENFLRQGVTTILNTLHSHDQPYPLAAYLATFKAAPNIAYFAGFNWTRQQVLELANRAPTPTELERMQNLVREAMADGAFGLASGLEYVPGVYAATEEVIALAQVAAPYGGIYVTHMRDEGAGLAQSVAETIRIAKEAGLPAHINHLKVTGAANYGNSAAIVAAIDDARAAGIDITFDVYPYAAFSTYSDLLFPAWALADGPGAFAARIADPATRQKIVSEMRALFAQQTGGTAHSIQFRDLPQAPSYKGKTLADFLRDRGHPATLDAALDMLIDLQLQGGFIGIFHSMDEADIARFMAHPAAMINSDGDLVSPGVGHPHPRSYGAFPRVLAHYVRAKGILSLEQAVNKMTALPAARIGLADRGVLRPGAFADIVVFDAATIADRATYTDPHQYAEGVRHLIINGIAVIADGVTTGALPGRALVRQ